MATGERANLSLGGTSSLGSYYCSGGALSYSVPLLSKVMTGAVFMNQFFFLLVEMRKRIFSGRVDLRKHL